MTDVIKLKSYSTTVYSYTYPDGTVIRWTVRDGYRIPVLLDDEGDYIFAIKDLNGVEFVKLILKIINIYVASDQPLFTQSSDFDEVECVEDKVERVEKVTVFTNSSKTHWTGPSGVWSVIVFSGDADREDYRYEIQQWLDRHDKDER